MLNKTFKIFKEFSQLFLKFKISGRKVFFLSKMMPKKLAVSETEICHLFIKIFGSGCTLQTRQKCTQCVALMFFYSFINFSIGDFYVTTFFIIFICIFNFVDSCCFKWVDYISDFICWKKLDRVLLVRLDWIWLLLFSK